MEQEQTEQDTGFKKHLTLFLLTDLTIFMIKSICSVILFTMCKYSRMILFNKTCFWLVLSHRRVDIPSLIEYKSFTLFSTSMWKCTPQPIMEQVLGIIIYNFLQKSSVFNIQERSFTSNIPTWLLEVLGRRTSQLLLMFQLQKLDIL